MAGREASPPKDSNADAIASRQVPGRAKASRMAGRICSMSRVSANSIIPEKRRWLVFVYFAQTSGFDRPGNNVRGIMFTSIANRSIHLETRLGVWNAYAGRRTEARRVNSSH